MLNIRMYTLGYVETNCYIVSNKEKECLIFDPAAQGDFIVKQLQKNNLKPLAILLTHAHFDHIGGIEAIKKQYDMPVYIHKKENKWLSDAALNGSLKYVQIPNIEVNETEHVITSEGEMTIGSFVFDVFHTPGHSPGSLSYVFKEDQFAIVGDTLFKGSIGRTDLLQGSMEVLMKSIRQKLLTLSEETIIYSGHGEPTTIADERATNPFLNER